MSEETDRPQSGDPSDFLRNWSMESFYRVPDDIAGSEEKTNHLMEWVPGEREVKGGLPPAFFGKEESSRSVREKNAQMRVAGLRMATNPAGLEAIGQLIFGLCQESLGDDLRTPPRSDQEAKIRDHIKSVAEERGLSRGYLAAMAVEMTELYAEGMSKAITDNRWREDIYGEKPACPSIVQRKIPGGASAVFLPPEINQIAKQFRDTNTFVALFGEDGKTLETKVVDRKPDLGQVLSRAASESARGSSPEEAMGIFISQFIFGSIRSKVGRFYRESVAARDAVRFTALGQFTNVRASSVRDEKVTVDTDAADGQAGAGPASMGGSGGKGGHPSFGGGQAGPPPSSPPSAGGGAPTHEPSEGGSGAVHPNPDEDRGPESGPPMPENMPDDVREVFRSDSGGSTEEVPQSEEKGTATGINEEASKGRPKEAEEPDLGYSFGEVTATADYPIRRGPWTRSSSKKKNEGKPEKPANVV